MPPTMLVPDSLYALTSNWIAAQSSFMPCSWSSSPYSFSALTHTSWICSMLELAWAFLVCCASR